MNNAAVNIYVNVCVSISFYLGYKPRSGIIGHGLIL